MCIGISIAPVIFGNTVTGLYEADENTHVIYYQNVIGASTLRRRPGMLSMTAPSSRSRRGSKTPSNWDTGKQAGSSAANGAALVIPLLTDDFRSIRLLRDTANTPHLLADIRRAVQPPSAGRTRQRRAASFGKGVADSVIIEQFDIYTLVQASRASLIPEAVKAVESRKRPPLLQEVFDALEEWYDAPFAVACFDPTESGQSKPIAYAYAPRYPDHFMIYTLDGHDGKVPDLNAEVELDHAVFAGSYRGNSGRPVNYSDDIPAGLERYVPRNVVGAAFPKGTRLINGDILVAVEDVVEGRFEASRVLPPNAPARKPVSLAEALAGAGIADGGSTTRSSGSTRSRRGSRR